MTRWEQATEIEILAGKLGIGGAAPVDGILDHCRRRIDGWVAEAGDVTSIDALEALVTQRLQMVFEEIRDDEDFDRLTQLYAREKREFVFATMRSKFEDSVNPTFGALILRRNATADSPDRYVAVIDCRGSKQARRFFTRWHEIAHRLTTHADGGDTEPGYRSEHDPIERLMDEIAGHVGFYGPIFDPAFQKASECRPLLTFAAVESIVSSDFPAASFQATLFACTRRITTPVVYIEAALNHKKYVKRQMATPSMFGEAPTPGELRAVKVIPNRAAQEDRFTIPTNMRVPLASVIHRLFDSELQTSEIATEDLSEWESQGRRLGDRAVLVEARKVPDRVIAIVQPLVAESTRATPSTSQPLFVE